MKCTFNDHSIKEFAKYICHFAKISDEYRFKSTAEELIIEALQEPDCLVMVELRFNRRFFGVWQPEPAVDLKIRSKACVAVFHNPKLLGKLVSESEMNLDSNGDYAHFYHKFKHGMDKRYKVPLVHSSRFMELPEIDMEEYAVHFQASIRSTNMHYRPMGHQEFVTLRCRPDSTRAQNSDELALDPQAHAARNHYYLFPNEFTHYRVLGECDITFSLKYLRIFTRAFDNRKDPFLHTYLTEEERPLVFCFDPNDMFRARLILAPVYRDYPAMPLPSIDLGTQEALPNVSYLLTAGGPNDNGDEGEEETFDEDLNEVLSRNERAIVSQITQRNRREMSTMSEERVERRRRQRLNQLEEFSSSDDESVDSQQMNMRLNFLGIVGHMDSQPLSNDIILVPASDEDESDFEIND